MKQNFRKVFSALAAVLLLLCACGNDQTDQTDLPSDEPLTLTVAAVAIPDTPDPTVCATEGSETIFYHLYENLMRWENDGYGFATLAPGQAASFTTETDYAGNTTYTFTLRNDVFWSDGQAVSAHHFVAAWQHLADPAYALPHSELLRCVSGYDAVQETGDTSLLGVSAPDSLTLIVTLNGSVPYFLETVCASVYTMPIRSYVPGSSTTSFITNGAYTVTEFSADGVTLTKSETYYDKNNVSVDTLRFVPSAGSDADREKFLSGNIDFIANLPADALQGSEQENERTSTPVTSTYGFLFNTRIAPFDSAAVRSAFRSVIDEDAIVAALGDAAVCPATGLVPYGISDRTSRPATEAIAASEDDASGESSSGKPPLVDHSRRWDFRTHSEEIVTLEISEDYAADCSAARKLLADAGFANGVGFPAVEYLYINTSENAAVAQLLCAVWQKELGITVTLRAVTAEEYDALLRPSVNEDGESVPPAFQIAAAEFTVSDHSDAGAFLAQWRSGDANNLSGYNSAAFDILMNAADAAEAAETYDAYLHDAEAILLEDAPAVPLFYRSSGYVLQDTLTELYCGPNGIYFFSQIRQNAAESKS